MTIFDIQLFADDEGAASVDAGGAEATPAGQDTAAETTVAATENAAGRASFDEIRKQYKDEINAYAQKVVERRLRKTGVAAENFQKMQPLIERTARKYGLDASDYDGISKAVEADRSYWQELADKNGTTAEVEEALAASRREARDAKAELERIAEEKREREQFEKITQEIGEIKAIYPDFDLSREMENPTFAAMANNPYLKLMDAYKAVHFDELTTRAMQASAQAAQQKTVNAIKSGNRPAENGTSSNPPAEVKTDYSKLSLKEINDIIERARRGEIIRF